MATSSPLHDAIFTPFVARKMTPRSRKSGYGRLLLGRVDQDYTVVYGYKEPLFSAFKKTPFYDDVRKMNWPKTEILFTVCSSPLSQSFGRGRISREGALDVRESRQRRDKIVPKVLPKKQKTKFEFWADIFHFLEQDRWPNNDSALERRAGMGYAVNIDFDVS